MFRLRSALSTNALVLVSFLLMLGSSYARGFQPSVNYPVGSDPFSLAVGDFNGDGKPDLAVANKGDDTVSILLGTGDGTFLPARTIRVGTDPVSIAAGDVNGDGKIDLVVACGIPRIVVLLNSSTGFLPPVGYSFDGVPTSLLLADFDKDGVLDLVAVAGTGVFMKGNGDGSFLSPTRYDAGPSPDIATTGDFNGDGNLDLAMSDSAPGVDIVLGNGDGTFQPATFAYTGRGTRSVAVGDFNRDGRTDLAVANCSTLGCDIGNKDDRIASILMGNGDGTFQSPVSYEVGEAPRSVAVGDFNGDGVLDVAVAIENNGSVTVMLGQGDGSFAQKRQFNAGFASWFVATGDFNHDRATDLVVLDSSAEGSISVLMNSGGTFVATTSSSNPSPVGQPVTFTAAVTPSLLSAIPTGNVLFKDGDTVLGTAPVDETGQASLTTSNLSQGTHTIKTKYSGDANYNPNTAKPLSQIVQ